MRRFGDLEKAIMERLWDRGQPATVREVLEDLRERQRREIAYTTVLTVTDILYRKGWLRRERDGRAYRYQPVAGPAEYAAGLMVDALEESPDRTAAFVRFMEQLSDAEAAALRTAMRRVRADSRAAGQTRGSSRGAKR